jgi:hypothetical protein
VTTPPEPTPTDIAPDDELERIPLHFLVPIGMTSRYAQHVIVQASEIDVTLSFFEVKAPIVLGDGDAQKEALKGGITAECVARVTIARPRFADFVKAFREIPETEKPK